VTTLRDSYLAGMKVALAEYTRDERHETEIPGDRARAADAAARTLEAPMAEEGAAARNRLMGRAVDEENVKPSGYEDRMMRWSFT
jgi:hypothetical protein